MNGYNICMEVYVFNSALLAGQEEALLPLLSPARREKVLRLRMEEARRASIAAGLMLRRYIGDAPLYFGEHGKPYTDSCFFSLSHSRERVMLAVSDRELGADTEQETKCRDAVARRIFTAGEYDFMCREPERRFFFLWTRKEAVLKLLGTGFARRTDDLSVLEDQLFADGREIFLQTVSDGGYCYSVASEIPASLSLRYIDLSSLL